MRVSIPFRKDRTAAPKEGPVVRRKKRSGALRFVLVLVVIGALAGGYLYWQGQQSPPAAAATINVPVMQGNLDVTVESSGKVEASRSSALKFEAGGRVEEVLVKAGDKVEAGQPLVRLNNDDLELMVTQAEANLRSAQAKLDDLKKGASEAEIASAQADLQAAMADLESARAGATAKEKADAEAELRLALTKLETLKAGATAKEIADAEAELRAAQAKLDEIKAPAKASDIAAAESDLKSAQLKLAEMKAGPKQAELSTAQLKVTQAETEQSKTRSSSNLSKQEAEIAYQKADRAFKEAQRQYHVMAAKALDEQGNPVEELPDDLQGEYRSLQELVDAYYEALYGMQDAEADYNQARFKLDDVRQQEIQDVGEAEAKVADAKAQLGDLKAGASAAEMAEAQLAVDKAQKALDDFKAGAARDEIAEAEAAVVKAQTTLNELRAGPSKDDLAAAQTEVDKAQNALNELRAGPEKAKVAEAQAAVAQKEAALQEVREPASASDIASAEEDVVQAESDLAEAKSDLAKAIVTAPFGGTVASVDAEANSTVAIGDTALSLYDPDGMHLEIEVSESDIEKVKVGQSVSIAFDALPDEIATGTVSSVSTVATSGQDVVTYKVEVQFDPGELPVLVGMNATATITVERKEGAVQVPNRALKTVGPYKTVEVLYGEAQTPVTVQVETGTTNGQMTEVVSCVETGSQCLREGDLVAVTIPTATGQQSGGRDMIMFGPGTGGAGGVRQGPAIRFEQSAP